MLTRFEKDSAWIGEDKRGTKKETNTTHLVALASIGLNINT
jgi:hypothetical protein